MGMKQKIYKKSKNPKWSTQKNCQLDNKALIWLHLFGHEAVGRKLKTA
jgi:hypothetical protein